MNLSAFTISVRSMIFPNIPVTLIPVMATNRRQAERFAKDVAQREKRIAAPVVVDEHAEAVRFRQRILAENRVVMPDLNGRSPMCFDNRYGRI